MSRNDYLESLKRALSAHNVSDIDEIISDYAAHFEIKLSDGFSEEEIAKRLGPPLEVATLYAYENDNQSTKNGLSSVLKGLALGLLSCLVYPALFALFAWVVVMVGTTLALCSAGVYLAFGMRFLEFMPMVPVSVGIGLGIVCISLGVLCAAGAIWCFLFSKQLAKCYCCWCKNVFESRPALSLSASPRISGKFRRRLRKTVQLSAIVFIISFISVYLLMVILAGSLQYWHVWGWFV